MINSESVIQYLENNTAELLDFVSNIDEDIVNIPEADGRWSIIQICDHLISVEYGISQLLLSPGENPSPDRESQYQILTDAFNDNTRKATAPENLQPKGKTDSIEKFKTNLTKIRGRMIEQASNKNLDQLCTVFPHFVFGYLTFGEWLYFCGGHASRHRNQMDRIVKANG